MVKLRARARQVMLAAAAAAGRAFVRLPGLAAVACAVAGTYLLAGSGWALIVAAGFLLLVDRRMP